MTYDDGISDLGGKGNLQNFVGLTVSNPAGEYDMYFEVSDL